jgi:hypothetical protein
MTKLRRVPRCGILLIGAAALVALPAGAQELRIAATSCAKPVRVVAKEVPLSVVLAALSAKFHFDIAYHARIDPLITIDEQSLAPDLVRKLARDMNFSLEEASDGRCAQGRRIAKLSVLPGSSNGNPGSVASAKPAWQTPEMERIGRLSAQDYLRSHGMANQAIEELAVH